MKKYSFFLILLVLLLAALACNLPYQNPALEVPVVSEPVDGFRTETRTEGEILVRIIVPNTYQVGQAGYDFSALLGNLEEAGAGLSLEAQNLLKSAQDDILMWGYDAGSAAGIPTSFVIIKNTEFAGMPLGILSNFAGALLGENVQIIEQTRLTIGGRDTLRWITVTNEAGYELTQAVYVFKDSGMLYLVGFNGDRQEVYGQLSVYDTIVASLSFDKLD